MARTAGTLARTAGKVARTAALLHRRSHLGSLALPLVCQLVGPGKICSTRAGMAGSRLHGLAASALTGSINLVILKGKDLAPCDKSGLSGVYSACGSMASHVHHLISSTPRMVPRYTAGLPPRVAPRYTTYLPPRVAPRCTPCTLHLTRRLITMIWGIVLNRSVKLFSIVLVVVPSIGANKTRSAS